MCGCMNNFSGNRPSEITISDDLLNFDGGGSYTDFVDDIESGDKFDNFFTAKQRERRRVRKQLIQGGSTPEEAKAKALEQVPRQTLKEIIAKLKSGESVVSITTPAGNVKLSTDPAKALDEVSNALQNSSNNSTNDAGGDGEGDGEGEQTFLQKNGKYLIIGAVVLVVGYFAYKKYR